MVSAVLLFAVAGCGGGSSTSTGTVPPAVTTVAPTTSTTTAPTTSSPPETTTSTLLPGRGFEPGCVDLAPSAAAAPVGDPALDVAGLLGAEPVVQLQLPTIRVGEVTDTSRPRVWRIPGGMLVELRAYNNGTLPVGALLAIDADGDVRWRRCFERPPDLVAAAQSASSEELVVGWTTYDATGPVRTDLEVWSLADGLLSRTWDDVLATSGISGAATENRTSLLWGSDLPVLVFGPQGSRMVTPDDTLLVVDLVTMTVRELPYPPSSEGGRIDILPLELTTAGRLMAFDSGAAGSDAPVGAVATSTGWSTDRAFIDDAVGVRADFFGGAQSNELRAFDSQGDELWRRNDILSPPFEGFHLAVDGDTVIASGCAALDMGSDNPCIDWTLWGIDVRTGSTRWEREGLWSVTGLGSGVATVAGPYTGVTGAAQPEWMMIDLATGRQVGDRTWTQPWSFGVGCCDEPARVYRSGGVVFTVDGTNLEMWYPEQQTAPLQVVSFG